jgi:hypothetical protein
METNGEPLAPNPLRSRSGVLLDKMVDEEEHLGFTEFIDCDDKIAVP